MSPDADLVDIDEGVAPRELLDRRFLVGETIIAQVPVAIVVVPLRSLRIAAAVADLDDDKPELRQRLAAAARIEYFRHALGLRSGIHEQDDGVLLGRIEVERL